MSEPSCAGLEIRDLDVRYGTLHAMRGATLSVAEGEIVALIGASGSGKSSLLRAVAGLEACTGSVTFHGEDVVDVPVHQRGFSLMFQDGQLFPHRSVFANVAFGLRGRIPKREHRQRASHMLELVGLAGYERRRPASLSGGQQQRVALARALAPRPSVVLLDEPLSALDRGLREQLSSEIRTIIRATHTCALYVTHDLDEALTVADRIIVLDSGTIVRQGSPDEVWNDPRNMATARLLGYAPFLDARLASLFNIPVAKGEELACSPGAFRWVNHGDTASPTVAARVLDRRVKRGAQVIRAELVIPREVDVLDRIVVECQVALGVDVPEVVDLALDRDRCAVVRGDE